MQSARAGRRCFHRLSRQPKHETVAQAVFDLWVDNIFAVHRRAAEPIKSTDEVVSRVS